MKSRLEKFGVFFISTIYLSLSIYPTISFYKKTPSDSVYTFLHNSVSDYPYYISFIGQGVIGRNTTLDQFTTEAQRGGLIHIFYLFLGKIGGAFRLTPVLIYFLTRIILGALFLFIGYLFITFFFKNRSLCLLAFFFFISSVSFPRVVVTEKGWQFWPFMFWWTEMDTFRRITFIPHVLFGHIGLMGILLLLMLYVQKKHKKYLISAVLLGLMTGFAHPPSLGMVYYVFGLFAFLEIILYRKVIHALLVFIFALFVSLTIGSLFYVLYTTRSVFPWTLMGVQESTFYAIRLFDYVLSLGPLFILGLLGILLVLFQKKKKEDRQYHFLLLPVLWVVIDIVMIPLSQFLAFYPLPFRIPTFANIRFLSMTIQLPLAVLGVYFLQRIYKRFGEIPVGGMVGLYVVLTVVMYPGIISGPLQDFAFSREYVYVGKPLVGAYSFLNKQETQNDTVLANSKNSLLLPLFAKNKLYFGQAIYTHMNAQKSSRTKEFFAGDIEPCEAYTFLREGTIYFILDERDIRFDTNRYPYLYAVYQDTDVKIWEVQRDEQYKNMCSTAKLEQLPLPAG